MGVFAASIIGIFLTVLETSFLPFFRLFGVVPYISLAFIVLLSVKYRGFFHFFLAFFIGIYLDYISGSLPGIFVAVFVSTAIIGRAIFYRDTGYDSGKSFFWLLIGSTLGIYLIQGIALLLMNNSMMWVSVILRTFVGTVVTLAFGLVLYKILDPFVDWLNKLNDEKYR